MGTHPIFESDFDCLTAMSLDSKTAAKAISGAIDFASLKLKLYVPFQKKQQLLEQSADCIATTTLLKTLGIEFEVEERANTEWMSSNGTVPVLAEGATQRVYCGCKEIQETLKKREIKHMLSPDDSQLEAQLFNLLDVLKRVELYHSWVDPTTVLNVTRKRYTDEVEVYSVFKKFVYKNRRENVLKFLSVHKWDVMSSEDVLREFSNVLRVFSDVLGEKTYLFGERISEIDCLLFGHLYSMLTTKYMGTFGADLQQSIAKFQNLIDHTKEIDRLSKTLWTKKNLQNKLECQS